MKILILAASALVLQLFLFLCTGSLILRIRGKKDYALTKALLLGYFVYFGLFEVLCLICELCLVPLSILSYAAAGLGAVLIVCGTLSGFGAWRRDLSALPSALRERGVWLWAALLALAASVVFVLLYTDASADSGWYVGMASTALATNTIGRFDPSTGQMIKLFQARYALSCYPYHNAVIPYLFRGLPPIVQARSVMSVINVIMSYLAAWQLGRAFFRKAAHADLFVLAVTFLNCFSGTIYLPGIFLYTRSYEGKALILNVVLVTALALITDVWKGREEDCPFRTLLWVMAAGVCFSASSIMALVLCFAALLPYAVFSRKWSVIPKTFCACLPVILWAAVYYLMQHGTLVFRTFR